MRKLAGLCLFLFACKSLPVIRPTVQAEIDASAEAIKELEKLPDTPATRQAITALRSNAAALRELNTYAETETAKREKAETERDENARSARVLFWLKVAAGAAVLGGGLFWFIRRRYFPS